MKRPKEGDINSLGTLYPGQRMDFVLRSTPGPQDQASMTVHLNQEYVNEYPAKPHIKLTDAVSDASNTPIRH